MRPSKEGGGTSDGEETRVGSIHSRFYTRIKSRSKGSEGVKSIVPSEGFEADSISSEVGAAAGNGRIYLSSRAEGFFLTC